MPNSAASIPTSSPPIGWTTEEREITNLVAGIALAAALLAGLASLLWFSRLP